PLLFESLMNTPVPWRLTCDRASCAIALVTNTSGKAITDAHRPNVRVDDLKFLIIFFDPPGPIKATDLPSLKLFDLFTKSLTRSTFSRETLTKSRIRREKMDPEGCILLLPTAAECFVELNEREEFIAAGLGKA